MANPITPSGRPRNTSNYFGSNEDRHSDSRDIFENARNQDEERQIRDDNLHFERTGENRPPPVTNDPLVPIGGYTPPDVARDGDSYVDIMDVYGNRVSRQYINEHTTDGEYAEDNPTRIIDPDNNATILHTRGVPSEVRSQIENSLGVSSVPSARARNAYMQREKIEEDKEFVEKSEENKKKFKDSISGLDI